MSVAKQAEAQLQKVEPRQLERLGCTQAALASEARAKQALLELTEEYRRLAVQREVSLEPFPEGWWASP